MTQQADDDRIVQLCLITNKTHVAWLGVLLFSAAPPALIAQAIPTADPVERLPKIAVTTTAADTSQARPTLAADLDTTALTFDQSLVEALEDLPAVSFARRGANNIEPSIRGFSFDRIATQFNGLPLLNASPTRTSAPVNFFQSGLIGQVTVERSLPSVTGGPITTGGRFNLSSFPATSNSGNPPSSRPQLTTRTRYYRNQDGQTLGASLVGATDRVAYRIGTQYVKLGDYTAGDGRTVNSEHESWGESTALRLALTRDLALELALHHYHQKLDRNISLPFDTIDTDFYAATLNATWELDRHTLRLRSGYTTTHPSLSTTARDSTTPTTPTTPTPPPPPGGGGGPPPAPPAARPVNTDLQGDAIAYSGGLAWATAWTPDFTTTFGLDATRSSRDVSREQLLTDDTIKLDYQWPDVRYRDLGIFGELVWQLDATRLRFGARLDQVDREARQADASIIDVAGSRGDTIRANYIAFNGPEAGITTRDHTTGATNLTLEHPLTTALTGHLGLGLTRMAPTPTESYRAFISNPTGVADLGNPALSPETKREAEVGLRYRGEQLRFTAQVYYAWVDDYIARQRILITPTTVFSFRNSAAAIYGGEAALAWTPTALPRLSLTAVGSTVRGEDTETGIGLAGLPPWNARVNTRYEMRPGRNTAWIAVEADYTAARANPNPAEATLFRDTASYLLWDLSLGLRLRDRLSLELALENLFDRTYYAYLTAYAATGPAGSGSATDPTTLAPGDSVPGVGRSVNLSMRWQF